MTDRTEPAPMRVLVADDETSCRLVVKAAVERLGYECIVANDGAAAWERFERELPDVVITDWMMPGMDGLELCRRVRQRADDGYSYIILATSLDEHRYVVEGMEAGADDYLTKPISPFDVQARLIAAQRVTDLHKQVTKINLRLAELNVELAAQARTDPLTSLGNRLRLHEDLAGFQDRAERYGQSYSLAIGDLDEFKLYNDTHGHLAGDDALRRVGKALASACRAGDGAYRYGGEEFLIIYSNQSLDSALVAAERTRAAVESLAIEHSTNRAVMTMSIGVAAWRAESADTVDSVLGRADAALYVAKHRGRNRVTAEDTHHSSDVA